MILKKLSLKNFKGVESFVLQPNGNGNVLSVFGANASGKTTLMDAFTWILFDKDSMNRADFEIKALDASGEAAHGLDHTVEAVLSVGDRETTLKKVFREKWVKHRGAATKKFTGHTTNYWIDGVPAKKKEYTAHVKELCDEGTFKVLTNPRYFNEVLHWQERRELLLEVCGDITDADVIASEAALKDLPAILGNRPIDAHRKVIVARCAEINKEIDKIPVRIDEVSGQKVEGLLLLKTVEENLKAAKKAAETAQQEKAEIEAGGMDAVLTTRIREIDNEISRIDNKYAEKEMAAQRTWNEKLQQLEHDASSAMLVLDKARVEHTHLQGTAANTDALIKTTTKQMEELRARWHQENNNNFELSQNAMCPTCGQAIPSDQLQAARDKAEQAFNTTKAATLEAINKEGMEQKERLAVLEKERLEIADAILQAETAITDAQAYLNERIQAVADYKATPATAPTKDPERQALVDEKANIEKQIAEKETSITAALEGVEDKIAAANERVQASERLKLHHESNTRIEARIGELEKQERALAAEYEKLESELFLTDEFIRAKVHLLEDKINSKFKVARFKLFDTQINEGLKECCEVLSNGVPYGSMNNAARIQIGVDITETLAKHFGKHPTVFIDNAESVSKIPETTAQQVRLVVSPDDETLRVA